MRVNPNANGEAAAAASVRTVRNKTPEPVASSDKLTLSGTQELVNVLKQIPVMRPEKIARGKELIADPSYPSDKVLSAVAGVLADNIELRKTSE